MTPRGAGTVPPPTKQRSGSNQQKKAGLLRAGGTVLPLDEPTSDLDAATLRALENTLDGCAVVISHDSFFLDRICNPMVALEGDAHVE